MSRNCYTYLIGWSRYQKFYYGVRYRKGCDPKEFWIKYHTSSSNVKRFRKQFGEPDIIQIRKTFGEDIKSARLWESKVLRRTRAASSNKWINSHDISFYTDKLKSSWNKGLTKETSDSLKIVSYKMQSNWAEGKMKPSRLGTKKEKWETDKNIWNQILKRNPNVKHSSYDEFCSECVSLYKGNMSIGSIAKTVFVGDKAVRNALIKAGIDIEQNQSWIKIKKRYPDFQFNSYDEFCEHCKILFAGGTKVYKIALLMGLSECTVNKAIKTITHQS